MKRIICAAAVCIISFILFGMSVAIMGRRNSHSYGNSYSSAEPIYSDSGMHCIFDHHLTGYGEGEYSWKINNEFPNIHINSAGATTLIGQWDGDQISVEASVPDGQKINVSAYYTSDLSNLYITAAPPNVSFLDTITEFGVISWLEDIFSYSGKITVTIKFPKTIYDGLFVKQGSGSLSVREFYAHENEINIGSGTFAMGRSENFTSDTFTVDLGSGKATISNMRTNSYTLDIGSGSLEVGGLTGCGSIDMGSGKCTVVYAEYGDKDGDGVKIDMGSGSLTLYVPENSGFDLETDIGSGYVNIDALGTKERITDDRTISVGSGWALMEIDMGSGAVNIYDAKNAPSIDFIWGIVIEGSTEFSSFSSTSMYSSGSVSIEEPQEVTNAVTEYSGIVPIDAPEAPSAPKAPSAPEFPL